MSDTAAWLKSGYRAALRKCCFLQGPGCTTLCVTSGDHGAVDVVCLTCSVGMELVAAVTSLEAQVVIGEGWKGKADAWHC